MGNTSQKLSRKNQYQIGLYNLSINANTSTDVLERFRRETEPRISNKQPLLIIFAIGINDSRYFGDKNIPAVFLDKFKSNLQELFKQASIFTNEILFMGYNQVVESMTMPDIWVENEYFDNKNVSKYNQALKNFCDTNKLVFINISSILKSDDILVEDGLHPNSQGHEKIFNTVKDFLIKNKIVNTT